MPSTRAWKGIAQMAPTHWLHMTEPAGPLLPYNAQVLIFPFVCCFVSRWRIFHSLRRHHGGERLQKYKVLALSLRLLIMHGGPYIATLAVIRDLVFLCLGAFVCKLIYWKCIVVKWTTYQLGATNRNVKVECWNSKIHYHSFNGNIKTFQITLKSMYCFKIGCYIFVVFILTSNHKQHHMAH